jgi:hypothetical protein
MAVDAIDHDVVVGGYAPSMARAGVGDAFGALNGVFFEPDQTHRDISSAPLIR